MAEAMLMLPRYQARVTSGPHLVEKEHHHSDAPLHVSPSPSFQEARSLTCQPVNSSDYFHKVKQRADFTRVPCKARGVSNGHNAQNAYIDIPRNAPHGLILACSNEVCCNSGRRFRYCSVCQTPAAKRNFHVRHAHGLNIRKGVRESPGARPPSPPLDKKRERRGSRTVSQNSEDMAAIAKQAILELSMENQKAPVEEPPKKVVKSVCSSEEQELTPAEVNWLSLLRTRPNFDNADETAAWLSSVIECSLVSAAQDPPVNEVEALGLFADDADEILSALECSDDEKAEEEERDYHFDFDKM